MSALSYCPDCGAALGARVSTAPVSVQVGDDPAKSETRPQCVRVLRFWLANKHRFATEAEAAVALGSTVVHSRMSNIKERHGELFDTKLGEPTNGARPRKLYRFKRNVSVRDLEA